MSSTAEEGAALEQPFAEPPAPGAVIEAAPGILWARLPLPMRLDHVNVYLLEDVGGWTLVDSGLDWPEARAAWERLLTGPLAGRPITRVVLTHHHPDHVGLLGWFAARGAEVLAARTGWLYARMLTLDRQERPAPEQIAFRRAAGMPEDALARYAATRPFNFADCVAPIPLGFRALAEGEALELGGRRWTVRLGQGHAPDHVTLWSEDGIVLAGDQMIAGISSNVSVYPTEPEADPLGEWLASCRRLRAEAGGTELVLPGHKLPFRGLPFRLDQLAANHESALERLAAAIAGRPLSAHEAIPVVFQRPVAESQYGLALGEALAHLHCLWRRGRARRVIGTDGVIRFHPS